jgi:outer membrane lipoprotein-sorting protein
MAKLSSVLVVSVLLLSANARLYAEEAGQAMATVDKALQAMGGEANVTKHKAATWKTKGTFYGMGDGIPYSGEFAVQWPDKSRSTISGTVNEQEFKMTSVLNGDKGWMKMNDQSNEMDDDRLKEQKEEAHARYMAEVFPLKDKDVQVSALPEAKVDDKPAHGVKATCKGHRDIKMYFDKDSGLLVKTERQVKTEMGEDANQETYYSNYKDVDGVKLPMKTTVKRDGKLYVEGENSDMKLLPKLDDKLFSEP